MKLTDEKITRQPRKFYPEDFSVDSWPVLQAELQKLLDAPIESAGDLLTWLRRKSELSNIVGDRMAWLYIRMTCKADDEALEKAFNDFYANIVTPSKPYSFKLEKKFYDSPYRKELPEETYAHLNRIVANDIELFREENIPLQQKEKELANKHGAIMGALTVNFDGQERTLKQMAVYFKKNDRAVREEAWRLVTECVANEADKLDELFDSLKEVRIQQAHNTGYENYRDYRHQLLARFDYTPDDVMRFHDSVEQHVVPFVTELNKHRREVLGVDTLRPWDMSVDLDGKILHPFDTSDQLIDKSVDILHKIDPEFAMQLARMRNSGYLDLDNRKGKAPGGYNYGIEEDGASFIFMNSVGLHGDVVTLLHESGHAVHSAAVAPRIDIEQYRQPPSELAELASMSMELLTMDYWDAFYGDPADLRKARRDQLEGTLTFLPWCMMVDALQQWVYTNPDHTPQQRREYFTSLQNRFKPDVDYTGLEQYRGLGWHRQLHIFEIPFYYIEYGISQLGALAIYRNYRNDPKKAIEQYKAFLQLGYTKPMREIYRAAGIEFDFSGDYIRSLVDFVREELAKL